MTKNASLVLLYLNVLVGTMFLTAEGTVAFFIKDEACESCIFMAACLAMLNFLHPLLVLGKQNQIDQIISSCNVLQRAIRFMSMGKFSPVSLCHVLLLITAPSFPVLLFTNCPGNHRGR